MQRLNRRSFLGQSLGAATGLVAGVPIIARAASAAPSLPKPCLPTAWQKHGIVLEADEPWEGGGLQNFTSPAEPLSRDRWRLWYSGRGGRKLFNIAYAEGEIGGPLKKFPARCTPGRPADEPFAIGNLPAGWVTTQVVHLGLNNGKHRLYFWAFGEGIHRYLAADSDDGRRYSVVDPLRPVLYHPHDRAAHGIASPDGVVLVKERNNNRPAGEPAAPAKLISNDATTVYQLPDGSFVMYSVALVPVPKDHPGYVAEDNAPGLLRVVDRYSSKDGLRFENRTRVIACDADDPADQQFYHLAVTYTPRGQVGMLGNYRVRAQTMDLEWCFSTDGHKWHRPQRTAWLPRGDQSQPDSYGIYPPSGLVYNAGKYHLFYTATNAAHNGKHSYGPHRQVVMYATVDSIWA